MITEHDLQEAIAECIGERNPNANTCIKLAAFYTIRDNLYPDSENLSPAGQEERQLPGLPKLEYNSYDAPPVVGRYGDSDFLAVVDGLPTQEVWAIMDELMETVKIINPRLYDGVLRKLRQV